MKSEERREHPRVIVGLPATVSNLDGASMKVKMLDLSLGGFKLTADEALIKHIQSDRGGRRGLFPEELKLEFTVSLNTEELHIGVFCRVVHKRRLSQHSYQLGLRILEYDDESESRLQRYIASQLG